MTAKDFFDRYVYDYEKDALGIGRLGAVYKAYDKVDKKYVAIKISQVKDVNGKYTLLNEVDFSKNIDHHTNVARYEFGLRVTQPFLIDYAVMDYFEEGNLELVLNKSNGQLTDKEIYEITEGVLEGIRHLHEENVIHRDLKLTNILMHRTKQGQWRPKIADFSLSQQTENLGDSISNSSANYTVAFAAPEQITNRRIRKNVDFWAFGVVLYRLLTNEMPFVATKGLETNRAIADISHKITHSIFPEKLNSIKEPYQTIIRQCWINDAAERVQEASRLLDILKNKDIPQKTLEATTEILESSVSENLELTTLIQSPDLKMNENLEIDTHTTIQNITPSIVEHTFIFKNDEPVDQTYPILEKPIQDTAMPMIASDDLATVKNIDTEKNLDLNTHIDKMPKISDDDLITQKNDRLIDVPISSIDNAEVPQGVAAAHSQGTSANKNRRKLALGGSVLVGLIILSVLMFNNNTDNKETNTVLIPNNLSQISEQNISTSNIPRDETSLSNEKNEDTKTGLNEKKKTTESSTDLSYNSYDVAVQSDNVTTQVRSKSVPPPPVVVDKTPQNVTPSKTTNKTTTTSATEIEKPEVNEALLRAYIKRHTNCNWGNIDEIVITDFNVDSKGKVSGGKVSIKYKYEIPYNVDCQSEILYYFNKYEWKSSAVKNGSFHFDSFILNY